MLTRNLPIFIVFGAAFLIGVGVIIAALVNSDDDGPVSSVSEFDAAQAAKIAYFESARTASGATCAATEYDAPTDIWQVECVMVRDGEWRSGRSGG
jgi:hypothetical protein